MPVDHDFRENAPTKESIAGLVAVIDNPEWHDLTGYFLRRILSMKVDLAIVEDSEYIIEIRRKENEPTMEPKRSERVLGVASAGDGGNSAI
jgi:hypothetical protein